MFFLTVTTVKCGSITDQGSDQYPSGFYWSNIYPGSETKDAPSVHLPLSNSGFCPPQSTQFQFTDGLQSFSVEALYCMLNCIELHWPPPASPHTWQHAPCSVLFDWGRVWMKNCWVRCLWGSALVPVVWAVRVYPPSPIRFETSGSEGLIHYLCFLPHWASPSSCFSYWQQLQSLLHQLSVAFTELRSWRKASGGVAAAARRRWFAEAVRTWGFLLKKTPCGGSDNSDGVLRWSWLPWCSVEQEIRPPHIGAPCLETAVCIWSG